MVLSMTGYGRAEQVLNGRDIVVELRSVNSRFFEYSSRVPRTCSFLEDKLKKLAAAKVSRGKVELNLSIQNVAAADTVVQVNWQLAKSYQTAMQAMSEKLDLKNDVTVSTICRFPDVLTQTAAPADPDTLWADVEQVAQQAVAAGHARAFAAKVKRQKLLLLRRYGQAPRAGGLSGGSATHALPASVCSIQGCRPSSCKAAA